MSRRLLLGEQYSALIFLLSLVYEYSWPTSECGAFRELTKPLQSSSIPALPMRMTNKPLSMQEHKAT